MVRYSLRAFAAAETGSPRELLARLNDALLRQLAPERFCTVALALLSEQASRSPSAWAGTPVPSS